MGYFQKFISIHFLVIICICIQNSQQISPPDSETYFAGVVDYIPETSLNTSKLNLDKNVNIFETIIASSYARKADILVFPAYSLNTPDTASFIPTQNDTVPPCVRADNDNFMSKIACAAQKAQKYVMVNVFEKENCDINAGASSCTSNQHNYFRTNIVFDRNGSLIARYRERALKSNYYSTVNVKPEVVSFQTDFGIKIGILDNYELLLWSPAQELINSNINDILYTGRLNSQLPFLTANQLLESWSYANDVNVIASGTPGENMTLVSTGIYGGVHGSLNLKSYPVVENAQVHISEIPKKGSLYSIPGKLFVADQTPLRRKDAILSRDSNISNFTTLLLEANATDVRQTLCHNQLCCDFSVQRIPIITLTPGNYSSYRYRLAAFKGKGQFPNELDSELEICAVLACLDSQLSSCGEVFANNVTVENRFYFSVISITANFTKLDRKLVMPSTLDGMLKALPAGNIDMEINLNGNHVLDLMKEQNDLLTFGMYTNLFHNITFEDFIPTTPVPTTTTTTSLPSSGLTSTTTIKPNKSSSCSSLPMSLVSFVLILAYSVTFQ